MDVIEVDGLSIGFERVGRGPPVVLLHGYLGDGPTTWRPQLDALGDEFTLVAWDAPGAGASSDPPEDLGVAGYADHLAAFIAQLDLDSPHVVGLSFGGALALELQRRHRLAATLTLVSAYAGWGGSLTPSETERRLQQAIELSELPPAALVDVLGPTMFHTPPTRAVMEAFERSLLATHPVGFRAMARASAEDVRGALATIDVPTLLVYGSDDVRAPLPVAEAISEGIDGATLEVIAGAGHVCNLEAPDEFNRLLRSFLHEQLGRAGGPAG